MVKCVLTFKASTPKHHVSFPQILYWPERVNCPCLSSVGAGKSHPNMCLEGERQAGIDPQGFLYIEH